MGYLFGLKVISDPDCCFDSDCPFERNVSNRIHSRCPQDSLQFNGRVDVDRYECRPRASGPGGCRFGKQVEHSDGSTSMGNTGGTK